MDPASVPSLVECFRLRFRGEPVSSRRSREAVSLASSSGMGNRFAAALPRAKPARSPVLPQSALAACAAFSPDVDADGCRSGDGLHSWIMLFDQAYLAEVPVSCPQVHTEPTRCSRRAGCLKTLPVSDWSRLRARPGDARAREQLSGISTIIILVMSAIGGSMFPRFLMSETMQKVGLLAADVQRVGTRRLPQGVLAQCADVAAPAAAARPRRSHHRLPQPGACVRAALGDCLTAQAIRAAVRVCRDVLRSIGGPSTDAAAPWDRADRRHVARHKGARAPQDATRVSDLAARQSRNTTLRRELLIFRAPL